MRHIRSVATWTVLTAIAGIAHAGITYEFTPGAGLIALAGTDPVKAAGIMAGASTAAGKWSGLIGESVTLKYVIDYDPALPALGAAFDVYAPTTYADVKPALFGKASSAFDFSATGSLQTGPSLKLWTNALSVPPMFPPEVDDDGSVNNTVMDISRTHLKGLGLLPATDGAAGADGTLKFGSALFDFDPSDGITAGTYDFVGIAMHEMAHSMGFISGVDTMSTLLPPFPGLPGGPRDATPMVTVLDLFRYSSDSVMVGPFVPDLSLPVPGSSPTRFFSIDGGVTPMGLFSTGIGLAGDGHQAGHWKLDPTFGLMDPVLGAGFELTAAFDALLTMPGVTPDLMALDVIGWTIVPSPSGITVLAGGLLLAARRRRIA